MREVKTANDFDINKIQMTPYERELILKFMDGDHELIGAAHVIYNYKYHNMFFAWLIAHNYKGKNFRDFLVKKFNSNVREMIEYICGYINASNEKS